MKYDKIPTYLLLFNNTINGGNTMPVENRNENTQYNSIFGVNPGSVQTYALIHISWELEKTLIKEICDKGGDYITMQDGSNGFGNGFIFNLSPEDIISLASRYAIGAFIYGTDPSPSMPHYYQKDEKGLFDIKPLDPVIDFEEFEVIAPECSEVWEDLYFNDFFREALSFRYGSFFEEEEDDDD